jgi:iron complex outermembrane receptor protein
VRYGGRLGPETFYRVYAKYRSFDDTLAANGIDSGMDEWDFTQTGFRIDGGAGDAESEWTLQGDAYRGHYDDPDQGGRSSMNEGANLLARWTRHYSDRSNLVLRLYHDYTRRDGPGIIGETLRSTDFELQHRLPLGARHDLVWGANYRFLNESVRNSEVLAFLPPKVNLHVGGIFAQDEMDLIADRVRLFSGVRFEHNSYSGWEVQPNVRIAWAVQPEHTFWGAVSRATRAPSRVDGDLVVPSVEPFVLMSDPDFRSETLLAYEVGWRGQLADGLAASITGYYHDYDHLRSIEPGTPLLISNGLKGHGYGAEFFLDWQVADWWRLRFGGFSKREETSFRPGGADIEGGLGEASSPRYQLLVRSGFDLNSDLFLWLALRSIGAVPAYALGVDAGAVPAYTELDACLRWTVRPGIEWSLTGRNLLHSHHPEIGESATTRREIERSIRTEIRWQF